MVRAAVLAVALGICLQRACPLSAAPVSWTSQAPMRLRGGSRELLGDLASLEQVLAKTLELTESLSNIESKRTTAPGQPAEAADARKCYLKEDVLPLFALAAKDISDQRPADVCGWLAAWFAARARKDGGQPETNWDSAAALERAKLGAAAARKRAALRDSAAAATAPAEHAPAANVTGADAADDEGERWIGGGEGQGIRVESRAEWEERVRRATATSGSGGVEEAPGGTHSRSDAIEGAPLVENRADAASLFVPFDTLGYMPAAIRKAREELHSRRQASAAAACADKSEEASPVTASSHLPRPNPPALAPLRSGFLAPATGLDGGSGGDGGSIGGCSGGIGSDGDAEAGFADVLAQARVQMEDLVQGLHRATADVHVPHDEADAQEVSASHQVLQLPSLAVE